MRTAYTTDELWQLDDSAAFWVWLGSRPADELLNLAPGEHLVERYLKVHGGEDAQFQTECGSRDCEGCGKRLFTWSGECDGSWQYLRLGGHTEEMSSWMFYEGIGGELDGAQTFGEAFAAFDAVMVEREREMLDDARRYAAERASWAAYFERQRQERERFAGLLRALLVVRGEAVAA